MEKMTMNEGLMKQAFIAKILLTSEKEELTKELKAKVMGMRIALSKIRRQFDEDCQEAIKGLRTPRFELLVSKEERTPEENTELEMLSNKINDEYNTFLAEKGIEEISFNKNFTEDEYYQIVEVNASNNVDINGNKLSAEDFLEIIYSLFVA